MNNTKQMKKLLQLGIAESFFCGENENLHKTFAKKSAVSELQPRQQLNQYMIIEEIGRGGMGVVYRALDTNLEREVAIKVISSNNAEQALIREAKSIAQLNHPNIINIFEVHCEPVFFFSMELIEGLSLEQFIKQNYKKMNRLAYTKAVVHIFISVAQALQFCHDKKIIHRDIKPENIMLDRNLQPKIMDFGIADKEWDAATMTGDLVGTPMYMSPEQAKSRKLARTSDIYSLGATLYEALTMRTIFQGDSALNIMYQIIHDDPINPRLLDPQIHIDLEAICLKCVEKKAVNRYRTMKSLHTDLSNYLQGKPVSAKPLNVARQLKRFIVRNKKLSIIVGIATSIIMVISLLYLQTLRDREDKLKAQSHALGKQQNQLIAKEDELKVKKDELEEKEAKIKKRNYLLLLSNLNHAAASIGNDFLPAGDPLKEAEKNYHELKLSQKGARASMEIRWLKNMSHEYRKKLDVSGKFIFFTEKNILIVKPQSIVYLNRNYKVKREVSIGVNDSFSVKYASISPDKNHLCLVGEVKSWARKMTYTLIHSTQDFTTTRCENNEHIFCFFYSNNTLLTSDKNEINIFSVASDHSIKKIKSISLTNVKFTSKSESDIFFCKKNERQFWFVDKGSLYLYDLKTNKIQEELTYRKHRLLRRAWLLQCLSKDNKLFVTTKCGRIFSIGHNKKVEIFDKKHGEQIANICIYNGQIYTSSDRQIFVHHHNGAFVRSIYSFQQEIKHLQVANNLIFSLGDNCYIYDISDNNPKVMKKFFNGQRLIDSPHSFSVVNDMSFLAYDFQQQKSKHSVKLYKPFYHFEHRNGTVSITASSQVLLYNDKPIVNGVRFRKGIYNSYSDEHYFYTDNAEVYIWSWASKKITQILHHKGPIYQGYIQDAYCDDEHLLLLSRYSWEEKCPLHIISLKDLQRKIIYIPGVIATERSVLRFCRAKQRVFISVEDKVFVWNYRDLLKNKEPLFVLENGSQEIRSFDIGEDGDRVIAVDRDEITIWNTDTSYTYDKRLLVRFSVHENLESCKYFREYDTLVTVGDSVLMWDFR